MAGSWPDVPSRKIPYHNDGTVVAARYPQDGAPYENFYEWDAGVNGLDQLNDLDFTTIPQNWANKRFPIAGEITRIVADTENIWIFPELRDLYGYVIVGTQENPATGGWGNMWTYYSHDTTNGLDGTWTLIQDHGNGENTPQGAHPEDWRTAIVEFSHLAVRGFKVIGSYGVFVGGNLVFRACYIFGTISAGETPDRILFIDDNTGLEFTKPMDWGDVPRGTILDWDIYMKNNSLTLTANTMVLDFTTLYNDSDTWYTIKATGEAFAVTHDISSIAPGARYPLGSDVLTVRLDVPDDEPFSIYEAILELSPAVSWT